MDNALQALLSWQFMLFSLAIGGIVWVVRTFVEFYFPKLKDKKSAWQEVFMPVLPIPIGLIMAFFATKFAYPDQLTSLSGRLLFGFASALLSSVVMRLVFATIKNRVMSLANGNAVDCPDDPQTSVNVSVSTVNNGAPSGMPVVETNTQDNSEDKK